METTINKLPENTIHFFHELSEYLDTTLYFYGSVQRRDYFHGKSDIDVDIFTDNKEATMKQLQYFLHLSKSDFKKIVWRIQHSNKVAHGYKVMYKNPEENITAEFSIYDERMKLDILKVHGMKIIVPFYISWILIVLKTLYYNLNMMNKKTYRYLKMNTLNSLMGYQDEEFLIFPTFQKVEPNKLL